MTTPDRSEEYLAAALDREAVRHDAGAFTKLGVEFDAVENEVLPMLGQGTPTMPLALAFWSGWLDAADHEWQYYPGIEAGDWPCLARMLSRALRSGEDVTDPRLLQYFGPQRPGGLRRLWRRLRGRRM